VTEGWRKLHNQELQSLYSSENTSTMNKSRMMRCVERVACMEKTRML